MCVEIENINFESSPYYGFLAMTASKVEERYSYVKAADDIPGHVPVCSRCKLRLGGCVCVDCCVIVIVLFLLFMLILILDSSKQERVVPWLKLVIREFR